MPEGKRELSELMIAKLIHDISGPVGAVSNGLEYLTGEEGPIKEQAFALVKESSEQLMARVQFYRIAYGFIYQTTEISISQLRQLSEHMYESSKVKLVWDNFATEASGIPLSNRLGKLLLNMLLISATCLLEGGTLKVALKRIDQGKQLCIGAEGPNVLVKPEWLEILLNTSSTAAIDTKNVQLHYTKLLASDCEVTLEIDHTKTSMMFMASYTQANMPTASA
ncbi:MAG: hypothetical protein IPP74_06615 [Alphaproteobacteria bacterium]|nr:hypothetical protein [Alphaproteobacteria bacterium]